MMRLEIIGAVGLGGEKFRRRAGVRLYRKCRRANFGRSDGFDRALKRRCELAARCRPPVIDRNRQDLKWRLTRTPLFSNADGKLDLVAPSKIGLWLLMNEGMR